MSCRLRFISTLFFVVLFLSLMFRSNNLSAMENELSGDNHDNSESHYPVTVTNCGELLKFDKAPERVVTLYPPTTEMMLALGLKDSIIGAAYTRMLPVMPEFADDYAALHSITATTPPPRELLLSVRPDFVFDNQPDFFYDPNSGLATKEELRTARAEIYSMTSNCLHRDQEASIDDIYTDLRNLGMIFNHQKEANMLILKMKRSISNTLKRIHKKEPVKVLIYHSGESPMYVLGGKSPRNMIFKLLGAKNVFPEVEYAPVSAEQVLARNADLVIVTDFYAPGMSSSKQKIAFFKKNFGECDAVKKDKVVLFPFYYMNPGIQNGRGVEALAKILYPSFFN